MPPVLLSGRSPSAIVLQGVSWWICVGRLVLLVPPAPLVQAEAALPGRRASLDHLVPGRLGPLRAAVRLWRRSPPGCLLPGRPGPRKALAASWWRAPPRCLLQGLLGPWKAAVRSWRRAPLRCGLRGLASLRSGHREDIRILYCCILFPCIGPWTWATVLPIHALDRLTLAQKERWGGGIHNVLEEVLQ